MKQITLLTVISFLALTVASYAYPGDIIWSNTYGGNGLDFGRSIIQTPDEGYIIGGTTESFGAGGEDFYLIKVDALGSTQWTNTYGGSGRDEIFAIQNTDDGGFILAGSTTSFGAGSYDIYIIKIDSIGDILWSHTYGGSGDDRPGSIYQAEDGGYIISGWNSSIGSGGKDLYLLKIDSNGNVLWDHTYGGSGDDYGGYSTEANIDGGFIIVGFTYSFGEGSRDFYVVKTDSIGNPLWTRTYGGSADDLAYSVQQTNDGGFIIAGFTESFGVGSRDVYLVKIDSSGDLIWTKTYGGGGIDFGFCIKATDDNGYIVSGTTNSFGAGSEDIYFLRLNADGDTLWTRAYGGTNSEFGYGCHVLSDNSYIVTGYTHSFGVGGRNVYLVKIEGDIPDKLVGYWPMDEVSGNMVEDHSDYANNGTATGTEIVDACIGNAREFGSTSDYITIPDAPVLNFYDDFTVVVWIKMESDPSPEGKILMKYESFSGNTGYEMSVGGESERVLNFQLGNPNLNKVQSTVPIPINEWVLVAGAREDTVMTLYIWDCEGEYNRSAFCTNEPQINSSDITIGYRNLGNDQAFPGVIDEVRLYNYALTAEDIGSLYQEGDCCGPFYANISGTVSGPAGGLLGVPVNLVDSSEELYESVATNELGYYYFGEIPNGDYSVEIQVPLGYTPTSEETVPITIAGSDIEVNFTLDENPNAGCVRQAWFWKWQVKSAIRGWGCSTYSGEELLNFLDQIHAHFDPYFDFYSAVDGLEGMKDVLSTRFCSPVEDRAKKHFFTTLLNVVSGRLHTFQIVSCDGATVSQAVTHMAALLTDNDSNNDWSVVLIAININCAWFDLPSGVIPLDLPQIAYRFGNNNEEIPSEFSLSRNYPNPFNSFTTFKYKLPEECNVVLAIYNLQGQKVETLVDEYMQTGQHSINWDASIYSSGVYFYKLTAGDKSFTKRLTLLK